MKSAICNAGLHFRLAHFGNNASIRRLREFFMAICSITGKSWMNGNRVSHSNIKTGRKLSANIQKKRVFDVETGRWVRVRLSTRALKTLNHKSLSQLLREQK